jgi:adenosylcobinamide kinase/adenosylcobinamide-phosphate guanylyltransferase
MGELIFILGGARSGKSTYALEQARQYGERVLFVATAQAFDDEMRERIERHRAERPAAWATLEAPTRAGAQIMALMEAYDCVVVDCITLLAANILLKLPEDSAQADVDAAVLGEIDALLEARERSDAAWLVVSNEVGMGVVPPTKLGRFYRDALGRANQRIAASASHVRLLVAGIPWNLR